MLIYVKLFIIIKQKGFVTDQFLHRWGGGVQFTNLTILF